MREMARHSDRRMTTAEVCEVLGCDRTTLMRNWREIEESAGKGAGATPFKQINRGRGNKTFWTEVEVTLLLEKMKGNANNQSDLPSRLEGVETSQSLDLQLALVERQAKDIERQAKELWKRKALEQEARAVKAELELLATEKLLANRTTGLSTYQRIAEAGGFALSDRDDVLGTYGRRV